MESLARDYPAHFSLSKQATVALDQSALEIDQHFTFGDAATLPARAARLHHTPGQGDFVVMDQREGDLWTEAGMVTTQADWSLDFDIGMTFKEWHGPVPLAHELQVFDRALKFLLKLEIGTTRAAPELDHDGQPAPGHFTGKLSQLGNGSRLGDAAERRRQGSPARGTAGLMAAAAQQCRRLRHSLLPHQLERAVDGAQMGAPRAPGP